MNKKYLWAMWPDDYMCPMDEAHQHVGKNNRDDNFKIVQVTEYGGDEQPLKWRAWYPMRAFLLGEKMMPWIQADVDGFQKAADAGNKLARSVGSAPVFGLKSPCTMVMTGFATEVPHCLYNESRRDFEPIGDGERAEFLRNAMGAVRHESQVFKRLGIDYLINVNMPQNAIVVCSRISMLPIVVVYGLQEGQPVPWADQFASMPEEERGEHYIELDADELEFVRMEMHNGKFDDEVIH